VYSVLKGAHEKQVGDPFSKGIWRGCYKSRNWKPARQPENRYPQYPISTDGHIGSKTKAARVGQDYGNILSEVQEEAPGEGMSTKFHRGMCDL